MDPYVKQLIAVRDDLRRKSLVFCNLIEANNGVTEPIHIQKVRDLIDAAINTIEDMPVA